MCPTLSFHLCVYKSVLFVCVSIPALQMDGGAWGWKTQEQGDICMHIADSHCGTAETKHCEAIILQLKINKQRLYLLPHSKGHTTI